MTIPILTYHALNISGNDYATNVTLPSPAISSWSRAPAGGSAAAPYRRLPVRRRRQLPEKTIAFTFDDAPTASPTCAPTAGPQRSMLNILRD
jgi:hypothetical protein